MSTRPPPLRRRPATVAIERGGLTARVTEKFYVNNLKQDLAEKGRMLVLLHPAVSQSLSRSWVVVSTPSRGRSTPGRSCEGCEVGLEKSRCTNSAR